MNKIINTAQPIGKDQIAEANETLRKYKAGKTALEQRIIANQEWWRLRHWNYMLGGDKDSFKPTSAWLFNVIINKHADAMEAYPMPNILPREEGDKPEASNLSSIIPCILQQNEFEQTYSDCMWQKLIEGTGVYAILWDRTKLNGMGDISIKKADLLNLFWEPGITDIQQSRNLFHTAIIDNEVLEAMYPQTKDHLSGGSLSVSKYIYDDTVDITGKSIVVDWYYKRMSSGKTVLHFCKYVNDIILYSTENEQNDNMGWYEHGQYPFVFDRLFPAEGTPTGFGYVDVCKSTQAQIDHLNQAITKNAIMSSTPRYLIAQNGAVNEKEFADWTKPFVHVTAGQIDDNSFKQIAVNPLSSIYVEILNNKVSELRETSGNTETSAGSSSHGVTAASAIAALQEASGKTSRDSTKAAYRAYKNIIYQVIELIRQFYSLPRQFRITGEFGKQRFLSYTNSGLLPQRQDHTFGLDIAPRLPVFDIEVDAEAMSVYSRVSQNELALQLYNAGVFNPDMAEQALMLLDTMDFPRKEGIIQKVSQQQTIFQQLQLFQQLAVTLASKYEPDIYKQLTQPTQVSQSQHINAEAAPMTSSTSNEDKRTENARTQAAQAPIPQ